MLGFGARHSANVRRGFDDVPDAQFVHGSPINEDEYLVTLRDALEPLLAFSVPLTFFGHTHLQGGFVTYTKESKRDALGVPQALLAQKGAVCGDVAAAMARGACASSPAHIAVSLTGVAGPEPDEDGNPVGRVCIGLAWEGGAHDWEFHYGNLGRDVIQERAMQDALKLVVAAMEAA